MDDIFDVIVIGAGPAGMMAAGRAAELGAKVLLLEKNEKPGKKLLITGGGRCNVTNAELDNRRLVERYGPKGKALFSAFAKFDAQDTLDFFHTRNVLTKIEEEKRAFPVSNKAEDIWKVMVEYVKKNNVQLKTHAIVKGFSVDDARISGVMMIDGSLLKAKNYILATGGKSHPETGSTGEGFQWLKNIGHTVIEPDPALVPLSIREKWVPELSGISLKGAKITVTQDGIRHESRKGKMLFTHFGISGPLVLNMSKAIGDLLKNGDVTLSLDLFPALDSGALDREILTIFERHKNKMLKNCLHELLENRMAQIVFQVAKLDAEKPLYRFTKEERTLLVKTLKDMRMTVAGLLGEDKAIVTSGGVDLKEVHFGKMQSKLFANLFFAGDVLDFDRPSGGFSLQICWTTGFIAGESAAAGETE